METPKPPNYAQRNYCALCTDPSYCANNDTCIFSTPIKPRTDALPNVPAAPNSSIYDSIPAAKSGATLAEIFDLLMAGKQLQLSFRSTTDAESLRTALYRFKRRTEGQMHDVGIDFDKLSLQWHMSSGSQLTVLVAVQLVPRKQTTYSIIQISDPVGTEEQNAQVPTSLGKT